MPTTMLYDIAGAAERLGVTEHRIRRAVQGGRITCRRPDGPKGKIFFAESDLEAYVAACTVPARHSPAPRAAAAHGWSS